MSGCKKTPRCNQPSIAYGRNNVNRTNFDLTAFVHKGHVPSANIKRSTNKGEIKAPDILTTTEVISAVGQIWNLVNPHSVLEPKERLNYNDRRYKNDILGDVGGEEINETPIREIGNGICSCTDMGNTNNISRMVQQKFEFLNTSKKLSQFEPGDYNCTRPSFWQFSNGHTMFSNNVWRGNALATEGILPELYGWMKELIPARSQHPINIEEVENMKQSKSCMSGIPINDAEGCISGDIPHPVNTTGFGTSNCYADSVKSIDTALCDSPKVATNAGIASSLYSDYFLGVLEENTMNSSVSSTSSTLSSTYHNDYLASWKNTHEKFQNTSNENEMHEKRSEGLIKSVIEEKSRMEMYSSQERLHYSPAKQEHAFAGAFAGIFVSLCLHPVDTIKTVIQSCRAEQKPICQIGRSIVSQRGVTGLYRGISSNIASSAPISAIYTFTYESVKGSLLPHFSKEHQSFAHCIAGGCASIATSFVFTPSERIKQQMQIGSHYHNCWNAVVGIAGKGGIPSLYTGWGAVLCRNIPHSIIKFYTYESLKQWVLSSPNSSDRPNTLQTLVCGGIAGSTAALFTTPFDVVKTRVQTQIPGSISQYDNMFRALLDIGRVEGLNGLYRGLIPRLVMYMSQGALFFASYEFFKQLFFLEMPQINAQNIQ